MAGMLKRAAASTVNKGHPSSFYNSNNKENPVLQALEQELKQFSSFIKKKNSLGYKPGPDEASSRVADTLFELWNKYEQKLPRSLYQSKLLEVGDFLTSAGEYNLALWQCFSRYLKFFGDVNVEEISDVETFKKVFFPDGFETEDAGFTFRALMGKTICSYQTIRMTDPKLNNLESLERCIHLLTFLRLVTQVILPKEKLCWLVYNGTIHIYSISRHLMTLGHSAKVLEYLLWACMCMEGSVPLMAVKYLRWRATLYTAVCQCYYDCKAGQHAEEFARRALSKVNELSQLEAMSNAKESKDTEQTFRFATVKMAVMVFKRAVFERRKIPKGLLRPKTRTNLKDAAQLPWPRTQTEKLLGDMFEGSASQMLSILEAMNDSNRRTLVTAPPAMDHEVEVLDVFAEMFLAAQEIIAGGGGNPPPRDPKNKEVLEPKPSEIKTPKMGGIVKDKTLIDMATRGEDGVPLAVAVKVVKHAYNYEQWDTFDTMMESVMAAIQEINQPHYGPEEKALEILQAYDKVMPRTKHRKLFQNTDDDEDDMMAQQAPPSTAAHKAKEPAEPPARPISNLEDHLIHLAEVLLSVVNGPYMQSQVDMDMVVDATILLWKKCKEVFGKYQTGSTDNPKYLQRMDNPSKWVYILDIVHQVLGWCGLSAVDPALTAEVVLRLALVFEASAMLDDKKNKSARSQQDTLSKIRELEDEQSVVSSVRDGSPSKARGSNMSMTTAASTKEHSQGIRASKMSMLSQTMLQQSVREQLLQAREILELGLQNVSYARQVVALTDGNSIADVSWVKHLNENMFKPLTPEERQAIINNPPPPPEEGKADAEAIWNTVKDLHLELMYMYHRVCLKLCALGPDPKGHGAKSKNPQQNRQSRQKGLSTNAFVENFEELVSLCKKNSLSRSLLMMQQALATGVGGSPTMQQRQRLEEALNLIRKAESEESRLFIENTQSPYTEEYPKVGSVPPPPLLLCRTDEFMTFKPAPFRPQNGQKVAWYRIFARTASGSNLKVRLNDYFLPGTGEEVPSFRCELKVRGLTPSEKYMFAVAAYTADGKLIGDSVGESTKPILASHPLPILMTWSYLCQVAYQVGCYEISKEACEVLWNHFVAEPPPPQQVTYTTSVQNDFKLTLHRLNNRVVAQASPVLLRMFLTGIFIYVDISVKQGKLFCDRLSDSGPLYKGQIARLLQCERMLVAMELAGWLNEANLALQAVVQCYGLLAPLIHYKIPAVPIIQVLEQCSIILQEIPSHLRLKRSATIVDSLHHMTACLSFHMAKVLRTWGQRALASNLSTSAREMLALDADKDKSGGMLDDSLLGEGATETGSVSLAALKKRKGRKTTSLPSGKDDVVHVGNEELKALEAHMLKLSKQAQGEHELSGSEDPSILHAYIAYLPSRIAYKEVVKFKRRARYLEFLVQTAEKALTEGIAPIALEWCEETQNWLFKRNENIIGTRANIGKQQGAMTIIGDDPKKYAAAMVEYNKDKTPGENKPDPEQAIRHAEPKRREDDTESQSSSAASELMDGGNTARRERAKQQPIKHKPRKIKYKPIGITPLMSDQQKQQQEDLELKALDILSLYFIDLYHNRTRKRKLRRISTDEMPWRSQLNIVMGLSQFGVFIQRLETWEKMTCSSTNYMYKSSFLDQEWFTFETAGTLVVGWQGGPSRQHTRDGPRNHGQQQPKPLGIEIAAAAATGKPPPPLFPLPAEEEDDTPRTYRSEGDPPPPPKKDKKKKMGGAGKAGQDDEELTMLDKDEALDMLKKTFLYFKRAVVLAHRGQHWTLLQNACRALWNCAHTALTRSISPTKAGDPFIAVETLRGMVVEPFYTAAICLLDMMLQMQMEEDRRKKKKEVDHLTGKPLVKSLMGDIRNEKGGSSLKFEEPLDDVSCADARWLRRLALRVIEMLYYENQWERLVDVALRFNALTDDRYAEQVNPLLVQAQRKLISRIASLGGKLPPQPYFVTAEQENGGLITAKDYTSLQLKIEFHHDDYSMVDPGARLDPEGHDAYSGGRRARKLVSVPLNVPQSLSELRCVLDQSEYTARGLQHSRRLLVLYLSGQNGIEDGHFGSQMGRGVSKVDFLPNTARPMPDMPVDLSKEEFLSMDDVQTSPLPKGQVGVVMSSYDKTIEMLMAQNQKGLAAEAMRELGNLHYHTGNMRGAYKWWSDALDTLLGLSDAIHSWRDVFKGGQDISQALLDKCGLWGCILGGMVCSNIAQYILTSNLGFRTECCFLSGFFFKALFRSSLPHPKADRDYALYEVGEGCEVTNLVPGIDLLNERFRCDGRAIVSALRFVMEELARGRHNLFVLPLLSLYQFLTTFTCRDLQRSVDGRILKVRVLTDLGLFREAFITLQRLLYGDRLPHMEDSDFRHVEGKVPKYEFDTSKPLLEPTNLKLLESIVDKRLSTTLGALYGPHLTCHLSLAQAHLLTALAKTIPVLPVFFDVQPPGSSVVVQPQTQINTPSSHGLNTIQSKPVLGSRLNVPTLQPPKPLVETRKNVKGEEQGESVDPEGESTLTQAMRRFTGDRKSPSLEIVKGTLLSTADQLLSTLSELVIENAQYDRGLGNLSPSELELVVQCKLELAAVATQRHHSAMAARIVLSALHMLQNAKLFNEKKDDRFMDTRKSQSFRKSHSRNVSPVKLVEAGDNQYQYQNFQSRSRLDARLWLSCKHALVQSLMGEVRGLGQVKGTDRVVKKELDSVRQYIAEGVAEAEACGDKEMLAEFYIEAATLNQIEGVPVEETKQLLKEMLHLLASEQQLSTPGELLRVVTWIQLIDLEAAVPSQEGTAQLRHNKAMYLKAHSQLLNQLEKLGEKIERRYDAQEEYSTPISPIHNLFLPHLLPLVQVKLRIGHAMGRLASNEMKNNLLSDPAGEWTKPLGVLHTALELSKVTAERTATVEAEIYLNIGKIQRQLYHLGQCHQRVAAHSLTEAIKTSFANEHDLGLIRQAYLELAILYLTSSGVVNPLRETSTMEGLDQVGPGKSEENVASLAVDQSVDDGISSVSGTLSARSTTKKKKGKHDLDTVFSEDFLFPRRQRSQDRGDKSKAVNTETENEKKAAWLAIRCAAAAGQAQRSRLLLIGDPTVTTLPISTKAVENMPDFISLDLISSYVIGEKKKIYKNEIEEELAPLTEALEPPPVETYEDELIKVREAANQLSWTHIMGYQAILQRLCSTATMTAVKQQERREAEKAGELGTEFDLGFISHAQFDVTVNNDVVRSTLYSGLWALRLNYIHQFLAKELNSYSQECMAIYPPKQLLLPQPKGSKIAEVDVISKTYNANTTVPIDIEPDASVVQPPSAPGTQDNLLKPIDKTVVSPTDNELCVQWYLPSLEDSSLSQKSVDSSTARTSLDKQIMLLFSVNKKKTPGEPISAIQSVSFTQLIDLHDRLTVLTSRGEISLPPGQPDRPRGEAKTLKKKSTRIKALSPKYKKDENLESLLRQCMEDIQSLLRYIPDSVERIEDEAAETAPTKPLSKKEKEVAVAQDDELIPFEVTKSSMHNLERIFDLSFGYCLREAKMLKWCMPFFEQQL